VESVARRLAVIIAGGGLALAVLTGCGAVNAAVDCATVADTMSEVVGKVGGDTKALKESTEKLRNDAKDIEDADLKQAALDFADEAESVNAGLNGDLQEGVSTDTSALQGSVENFTSKCNALG
jgi:hypothetical protein